MLYLYLFLLRFYPLRRIVTFSNSPYITDFRFCSSFLCSNLEHVHPRRRFDDLLILAFSAFKIFFWHFRAIQNPPSYHPLDDPIRSVCDSCFPKSGGRCRFVLQIPNYFDRRQIMSAKNTSDDR
jgi:hypothetical protein